MSKNRKPIAALLALLTMGALTLALVPQARATEPSVKAQLKLALAKVATNEAGFSSLPDVALVYSAAGSVGRSDRTRLNWLRSHSRRVLGDRECTRGNCRWTRGLGWDDLMPPGWDVTRDGTWRPQRWARVRRWAHEVVEGTITLRACPGEAPPQTWGGAMDHERAVRNGLVALGCRAFSGSLNEGYRYLTSAERAAATASDLSGANDSAIPANLAQGSQPDE